jgi:hypothetical protein
MDYKPMEKKLKKLYREALFAASIISLELFQ